MFILMWRLKLKKRHDSRKGIIWNVEGNQGGGDKWEHDPSMYIYIWNYEAAIMNLIILYIQLIYANL